MSILLRRREFIVGLGGAAAWPLAARAQQGTRVRRIGVLGTGDENELVAKAYVSAFADLGWPLAATCGWTFVGAAVTPIGYERSRRSWSPCNLISS